MAHLQNPQTSKRRGGNGAKRLAVVLQEVFRCEKRRCRWTGHVVGRILCDQLHLGLPSYKARSLEEVPLRPREDVWTGTTLSDRLMNPDPNISKNPPIRASEAH